PEQPERLDAEDQHPAREGEARRDGRRPAGQAELRHAGRAGPGDADAALRRGEEEAGGRAGRLADAARELKRLRIHRRAEAPAAARESDSHSLVVPGFPSGTTCFYNSRQRSAVSFQLSSAAEAAWHRSGPLLHQTKS